MQWLDAMHRLIANHQPCVVVMISHVEGSSPRGVGARMVVSAQACYDTIGGGALEQQAIDHARVLLSDPQPAQALVYQTLTLGKDLSQCCGGRVTLQFDVHPGTDLLVHVFGAGHVAQEVARLLLRLPCSATFHDSRPEWLEKVQALQSEAEPCPGSGNVYLQSVTAHLHTRVLGENPYLQVEQCAPGAYYLIMTHCHELDFELLEAVLTRGDAAFCGLIASQSKAASFRARLARKGFTEAELAMLTSPLGKQVATGNQPMEVAIAALADVLTERQRRLQVDPVGS